MASTAPIASAIEEEFRNLAVLRDAFPMLCDWGVRDESVLVHSLGCNYLAELGRSLGFWAMNEFPVRVNGARTIRPDAVWWNREDRSVRFLTEFERFTAGQETKLADKAKNLLEVYHAAEPKPPVVLLMGWATSGTDLTLARKTVAAIARDGFRNQDGKWVAGVASPNRFLLYFAIFGKKGDELQLISIQP